MEAEGGCGNPTDAKVLAGFRHLLRKGSFLVELDSALGQRDGLGDLSKTLSVLFSGLLSDIHLYEHMKLVEAEMSLAEELDCFLSLLPPNQ